MWSSDCRAQAAGDVLAKLADELAVVAVGGTRGGDVKELADRFQLQPVDDLRHTVTQHHGAWVFIADAEGVDQSHLNAAADAGSRIVTLDPLAADFDQLRTLYHGSPEAAKSKVDSLPANSVTFLPALVRTAGWRSLRAKPADLVAAAVVTHFESAGQSGLPLFAHLYDAWLTMLSISDMPDVIDCSLSGTPAGGGPANVPDKLRALSGHMIAHARLPGRASALISVSNIASRPRWRVSVQGATHAVDICDRLSRSTTDEVDADSEIDHPEPAEANLATKPDEVEELNTRWIDAAAAAWRRALLQPDAATDLPPTRDYEQRVLACCLACLLSAKTREPESPLTLLQLQA